MIFQRKMTNDTLCSSDRILFVCSADMEFRRLLDREVENPTHRYAPTYSVGFFVLIIFILQGGIYNHRTINFDIFGIIENVNI